MSEETSVRASIDTSSAHELLSRLRDDHEHLIQLLVRMVEAESPSTDAESQRAVQGILTEELENLGFDVQLTEGKQTGGYLVARPLGRSGDRPAQLLLGHCDTVWPLGTLETMPISIREGRMTGPGVYDMKAGLVQVIGALRALEALGLEPEVEPLVFVSSDEEIGGAESKDAIVSLSKDVSRVLVVEPPLGLEGHLKTARKGLGRFDVLVRGESAHAGLDPGKGISAVLELTHVVQKLFALTDLANGLTVNVGTIEGGSRPNVVAAESRASVDVRVVSTGQAREVEASIRAIEPELTGARIEIEGGFDVLPLERTPANRALWRVAKESAALIGVNLQQALAGGASDGNLASQYAPTLDGLGPVGDGAHARHEFIELDSLIERGTLLAMLILAPAQVPDEP
jgi:glutamate carboxypeptidase